MGLFSWCTSDTQKSISMGMDGYPNCPKKVYVLNPFGLPYVEENYDGFGTFGGRDIYALVAQWNCPDQCKDKEGKWLSDEIIRDIGIDIACYDQDHVKLKYPIKIVERLCSYEAADISPCCPYQGYFYDEGLPDVSEAFADLNKEIAKAKKQLTRSNQKQRSNDR